MPEHHLFIKNMVCPRCIKTVSEELAKLQMEIVSIKLGKVVLKSKPDEKLLQQFSATLNENGFELLTDRKTQLISQVKSEIIKLVHQRGQSLEKKSLSSHLSKITGNEYSSLSKTFSEVEGITIERYFIRQKIEKVKELLIYDELSVSEIAFKLEYSSNQHLSSQFKKEIGMTPSEFKRMNNKSRKSLDEI
ncbi:MAG: AraC family transcriptional regulator [Draconibacterium sp.]|nr:AraC family transcriptional regulator [Draconibacterium sp.]